MKRNPEKHAKVSGVVTFLSVSVEPGPGTDPAAKRDDIHRSEPEGDTIALLRDRLKDLGFRIIATGKTGISISGPREVFEEVFRTRLEKRTREVSRIGKKRLEVEYFEAVEPMNIPEELSGLVEAVALSEPPILFE